MTHRNPVVYNVPCGNPDCDRCARWAFELATEKQRRRQEWILVAACWITGMLAAWIAWWR